MLKRTSIAALGLTSLLTGGIALAGSAHAADCQVSHYHVKGHRGSDEVRCIQQSLNEQGIDSGPVDGWFGPITEAAVVTYQTANALVIDGEVGAQTAGSLGVWTDPPPPPPPTRAAKVNQAVQSIRTNNSSRRSTASSGGSGVWDRIAQCESGGNWGISTGNGYYGGLQFTMGTWRSNGGSGNPANASREEQIRVAENVRSQVGYSAWPACSRKLGLR